MISIAIAIPQPKVGSGSASPAAATDRDVFSEVLGPVVVAQANDNVDLPGVVEAA